MDVFVYYLIFAGLALVVFMTGYLVGLFVGESRGWRGAREALKYRGH